jgi:murein peptide amidase A
MRPRHGGAVALALIVVLASPALVSSGSGAADPVGRRNVVLGRSVDGRQIVAVESGDFDAGRRMLVVGCIHGSETAGIAVAERLVDATPPRELDLWIVSDLNPDGAAAGTRGNAHGVDLNRNFPWRWRPLQGLFDSGPRPLSETESRLAYRLIRHLRPRISIWFHQHLGLVDESGGDVSIERRFASLAGLPLFRLVRYPGSVVGWENHADPGTTAFVVELPAGSLTAAAAGRYARAALEVAKRS